MPKNTPNQNPAFDTQPDEFVTDAQVKEDLSKMGCLLTNPWRSGQDLRDEADQRLDVARELLMGIGAMPANKVQVEDAQAACSAAAMLIGDSVALMDSAFLHAEKEG
jgi:hypothetical protein